MLPSRARPRAPSTAALRILYQLAYISSGTVLGVGALCMEERRRRTQYVQRIAENARRLRQCSRHMQSVALAAHEAEGEVDLVSFAPGHGLDEGALGPELPSVVAREYERTAAGDGQEDRRWRRRKARRRHDGEVAAPVFEGDLERPPPPAAAHVNDPKTPFQSEKLDYAMDERPELATMHSERLDDSLADGAAINPRDAVGEVSHQNNFLLHRRTAPRSSAKVAVYKFHRQSDSEASEQTLQRETGRIHRSCRATPQVHDFEDSQLQNPMTEWTMIAPHFKTKAHWQNKTQHQLAGRQVEAFSGSPLTADDISADVKKLVESADIDGASHMRLSPGSARTIAGELLLLALQHGLFDDVRSLTLRENALHGWSHTQCARIAASLSRLAKHAKHADFLEFCADVFSTNAIDRTVRREERLDLMLTFAVHLAKADIDLLEPSFDLRSRKSFPPLRSATELPGFQIAAEKLCRQCIEKEEIKAAVVLAVALPFRHWARSVVSSLAPDLFDAAVKSSNLSLCTTLIRWVGGRFKSTVLSREQMNAFAHACGAAGKQELLRRVFRSPNYLVEANRLLLTSNSESGFFDEDSCTQICIALADGHPGTSSQFRKCYASLTEQNRTIVSEHSPRSRIECLKAAWEVTHDFGSITAGYKSAKAWIQGRGSADDLEDLRSAVIQIACNAEGAGEATFALFSLDSDVPESSAGAVAVLAAAKASDWDSLEKLIPALRDERVRFEWSGANHAIFNKTLFFFSKHHSSQQTMDFCLRAVEQFGLVPDRTTLLTVLKKSISDRRPDLIAQCFQTKIGSRLGVDADMAANLLSHFYTHCRPSHIMTMWTCQHLVRQAPSLASDKLRDIAIEAICHDLRKLRGKNRETEKRDAYARLIRLRRSEESVPAPYERSVKDTWRLMFRPVRGQDLLRQDDDAVWQHAYSMLSLAEAEAEERSHPPRALPEVPQGSIEASGDSARSGDASFPTTAEADTRTDGPLSRPMVPSKDSVRSGDAPKSRMTEAEANTKIARPGTFPGPIETWGDLVQPEDVSPSTAAKAEIETSEMLCRPLIASEDSVQRESASKSTVVEVEAETRALAQPEMPHGPMEASDDSIRLRDTSNPMAGAFSLQDSSIGEGSGAKPSDFETQMPKPEVCPSNSNAVNEGLPQAQPRQSRPGRKDNASEYAWTATLMRAFSLGKYRAVIQLYEKRVRAVGHQRSPKTLRTVVEASLRAHDGDQTHAEELLSTAKDAGMNVNPAMGRLLLNQLRKQHTFDKAGVDRIRTMVNNCYRWNEESGLLVQHDVAAFAAHKLIKAGLASDAIGILDFVRRSDWARKYPVDMVMMTVWVDGYAALGDQSGIEWAVKKVLKEGMRINRDFVAALKNATAYFPSWVSSRMRHRAVEDHPARQDYQQLDHWRQLCKERMEQQRQDVRDCGIQLARTLAAVANGHEARERRPTASEGGYDTTPESIGTAPGLNLALTEDAEAEDGVNSSDHDDLKRGV